MLMKFNHTLTLDYELIVKLKKEKNASFLVNGLIETHYKKNKYDGWTNEQLDIEIKALELEQEAKEVRNGK